MDRFLTKTKAQPMSSNQMSTRSSSLGVAMASTLIKTKNHKSNKGKTQTTMRQGSILSENLEAPPELLTDGDITPSNLMPYRLFWSYIFTTNGQVHHIFIYGIRWELLIKINHTDKRILTPDLQIKY